MFCQNLLIHNFNKKKQYETRFPIHGQSDKLHEIAGNPYQLRQKNTIINIVSANIIIVWKNFTGFRQSKNE